jgi:outer membrane murein-binding lipoprotein Lpp
MKSRRVLVLSAVILSLVGCASLLGYSAYQGRAARLLHREQVVRRQTARQLQQLQSACERLAGESERLRQAQADLTAKHALALQRLDALSGEVEQLCKSAAVSSHLPLPANWHERLIAANQPIYDDICDMICNLMEDDFPTVRTWYGETWHQLVQPFRAHQFPAESHRDQLVELLGDIMQAERQRMQALGEQPILTVASGPETSIAGYCLGPRWERLVANLRALQY